MIVYGIARCDTVRKARAWLAAEGVAHTFHDFGKDGVPAQRLAGWLSKLGRDTVLNRRGTTWRQLEEAAKAVIVDDATAVAAITAHPSLVKRPLVEWPDGSLTVGFEPSGWARAVRVRPPGAA